MATTTNLLPFTTILLLSLLHLTTVKTQQPPKQPPQSLLNAAETLSNSGYNAMSLTLQLILSDSTISLHSTSTTTTTTTTTNTTPQSHPTLTIFTPPDSSFASTGQPSLSLLLLHFSSVSLSPSSLSSFPFSTKIPTLSPSNTPLFITSSPSDQQVSINNVKVLGSPLYDDGSVIVFAVSDFFDPNFTLPDSTQNPQNTTPECITLNPFSSFFDASSVLKSRGYSIMASFLDLQLMGFAKFSSQPLKLTVFAPEDEVLLKFTGDIPGYTSLFLRHMFPCKLSWVDLTGIENGTQFKDYLDGFSLKIEKTNKQVRINGVDITFPDMYYSDWLIVHGIRDVIPAPMDGSESEDDVEEDSDSMMHTEVILSALRNEF